MHLEVDDMVRLSEVSRRGYKMAHQISETATGWGIENITPRNTLCLGGSFPLDFGTTV